MPFKKFAFKSLDEVKAAFAAEGSGVCFSEDLSVLRETYDLCGRTLPNRLAYHPMEGADGERDGSPSVHTRRRYERFARGGAGLIWFEAVAVMEEGRANPLQLWIHPENVQAFKKLNEDIRAIARETFGEG
ncbi:MAG: flavin oxidoreductase/NADH oxidase, partial [Clostridia bacterium]|nr:flavin oxidoreductase/NADH oxidase [Clostridia bacterium]